MLRASEILPGWNGETADIVVLDYEDRHRRRIVLQSAGGTSFLLDLADVPDLRDGDALKLSSGDVIAIRAAPEALMEIRCSDSVHLARIAWHIGNRHLAAEIGDGMLRIRADHVIGEMVRGLGGTVTEVEAPFNPEGGAYGGNAPVTGHDHGHGHSHGHHHHHGQGGHDHG